MMDLPQLIDEVKKEKVYWISIGLMILSVILYTCKIPYRELVVLGAFIIVVITVFFRVLK
jgi:hypothetical protein